jgi:hypothetical protein
MNFVVRIDHLSDEQLEFFGWVRAHFGPTFSLYWNPRYNEYQPVQNDIPRVLVVDDYNDAVQMAGDYGDWSILQPQRGPK